MVVEFGLAVIPQCEAPAIGADALGVEFRAASDQGEGGVFDADGGIGQNRAQTGSGGGVRHFQAAQVSDRGIDIDEFDQRTRRLATFHTGSGDDQRSTATALKQRILVPPLPLAGVIAMITDENDDRPIPELILIQHIQHAAELRVHETGARAVGVKQLPPFSLGELAECLGVVA